MLVYKPLLNFTLQACYSFLFPKVEASTVVRHRSQVGKGMTFGVLVLIANRSEEDVPLFRWDIISAIGCIVVPQTDNLQYKLCFSLTWNLHAQCASVAKNKNRTL